MPTLHMPMANYVKTSYVYKNDRVSGNVRQGFFFGILRLFSMIDDVYRKRFFGSGVRNDAELSAKADRFHLLRRMETV